MPRAALPALGSLLLAAILTGCCCGSDDAPVNCSTMSPTLDGPRTVGRVTLTPDGHRLTLTGLPEPSRWVIARGPALSLEPFAPVLDAVEQARPDALLILGSFGAGERLDEMLDALAGFRVEDVAIPVFFVPGPRDRASDLHSAIAAREAPSLVSLAGFHVVELGGAELLVASGGLDPHYVAEGGCRLDDLGSVLEAGTAGRARVLVGFDAPSGTPLTRGLDDLEAGSPTAREAMQRAEVTAGIFAGPDTSIGRFFDDLGEAHSVGAVRRVVVPPLVGPIFESAGGERATLGPFVVSIGADGIGPASAPSSP